MKRKYKVSAQIRRNMSLGQLKRYAAKAKGVALTVKEPSHESQEALNTAFVLGKVDSVIEQYCASVGIPKAAITYRVAQLLLGATSGQVLGVEHSMPSV